MDLLRRNNTEFVRKLVLPFLWQCPECYNMISNEEMASFDEPKLCGKCLKAMTDCFIVVVGPPLGEYDE